MSTNENEIKEVETGLDDEESRSELSRDADKEIEAVRLAMDAEFDVEQEMAASAPDENFAEKDVEEELPAEEPEQNLARASAKTRTAARESAAGTSAPTRRQRAVEREAREKRRDEEQIALTVESSLRTAQRERRIFSEKAIGIEPITNKDGVEVSVGVVLLLDGKYKVLIPYEELYTIDPIDMKTVNQNTPEGILDYYARKRAIASKLVGSECAFCINRITEDDGMTLLIGSRRAAMRLYARRNFTGANARYKAGDVIDGVVVTTAWHAATVNFAGVDVVIPQYRLSLRFMHAVSDVFKQGDIVTAKITEIKTTEDGVRLTVNPIEIEMLDARSRYNMVKNGSTVTATVTNVYRPEGARRIYIYAWIDGYNLPAKVISLGANDFGREIKFGSKLTLNVLDHEKSGLLVCRVRSEHGFASAYTRVSAYRRGQ